jgi:chromosome partitioning protein
MLRRAQEIRGGLSDAVIVLSIGGKNYRLTEDLKEAATTLVLPRAKTPIILRQVCADAPVQGAVVWHTGAPGRPPGKSPIYSASFFRTLDKRRGESG